MEETPRPDHVQEPLHNTDLEMMDDQDTTVTALHEEYVRMRILSKHLTFTSAYKSVKRNFGRPNRPLARARMYKFPLGVRNLLKLWSSS